MATNDYRTFANAATVNKLWTAFLREEHKPTDSRNNQLIQETRKKVNQLSGREYDLAMEAARIFAQH